MYEELDKLITFIQLKYNNLLNEWKQNDLYIPINLRKNIVKNINENDELLKAILNYRLFINKNNLKCIDSSKEVGYTATHIYFQNDNYSFPWELQVWDKSHEKSNIESHERYKQEYIKWEKENKGGVLL